MNSFEKNFVSLFTAYLSPLSLPAAIFLLWYIMEMGAVIGLGYALLIMIITKILTNKHVPYRR